MGVCGVRCEEGGMLAVGMRCSDRSAADRSLIGAAGSDEAEDEEDELKAAAAAED